MDEVDVSIIGGGVVGLAVAAKVAEEGRGVVLLERHESFGRETSSRNSEVIHAGLYYPPGSMKALLCVEGARMLYDLCARHSVPHARLGKLIVATRDSELPVLDSLMRRGGENGAGGLSVLDSGDIARIEPNVKAIAAIRSRDTGIVDSHSLMKHLYGAGQAAGVTYSFGSEVDLIEAVPGGYELGVRGESYRFLSRVVVNSAGLSSERICSLAGIDTEAAGYGMSFYKGSYFSYLKPSPVEMLVYPLPNEDQTGLGVHATLDLAGRLRLGPDSEPVDSIDYGVDPHKGGSFYEGASRFIKGLDPGALAPDMAGIRPRLRGDGFRDFVIRHEAERGLVGFVSLVGIESPGLTASLAIARGVGEIVEDILG